MENKSETVWLNLHRWGELKDKRVTVRADDIVGIEEKVSCSNGLPYTAIILRRLGYLIEVEETYDEIRAAVGFDDSEGVDDITTEELGGHFDPENKYEDVMKEDSQSVTPKEVTKRVTVESIIKAWLDAHGFNALKSKTSNPFGDCVCHASEYGFRHCKASIEHVQKCTPFNLMECMPYGPSEKVK